MQAVKVWGVGFGSISPIIHRSHTDPTPLRTPFLLPDTNLLSSATARQRCWTLRLVARVLCMNQIPGFDSAGYRQASDAILKHAAWAPTPAKALAACAALPRTADNVQVI